MSSLPSVCLIGAGSSGITVAKGLKERGIPFDCFDKSDRVGGNWVFGNKNRMSAAYETLHINTSRERMEYSDYPMPKSYPDFPHHSHIAEYFDDYVDHFGVREHIRFETGVERASLAEDGTWRVELDTGEERRYDALAVANGHHWNPRWPEPAFEGEFDGVQMHAHDFRDGNIFEGKRVLVLGMGNSAMDIVAEASIKGEKAFLAARRGAYVLPKYVLGRPVDQYPADPRLPWAVRQKFLQALVKFSVGDMENYGLPKPDHRMGEAHPTLSDSVLSRLAHGEIAVKPNIERLEGDSVRFADGTVEQVDVIVYCTGYKVTFPFFDEGFIAAPENDLPLFRRVWHPDHANLAFFGLLQPLGAIMPLAEAQGRWFASYLRGEYALPSRSDMLADMERERRAMFKRYVASKRHTMQVDYDSYLYDLGREIKRGAERARAQGYRLPVEARAGAGEGERLTA